MSCQRGEGEVVVAEEGVAGGEGAVVCELGVVIREDDEESPITIRNLNHEY